MKPKTFKVGRVYVIEWFDHWADNSWHPINAPCVASDVPCTSVGICTHDDKDMVHLSATVSCPLEQIKDVNTLLSSHATATMGVMKKAILRSREVKVA